MNAELKNGNLIITIPHGNLKSLPETDSKLSYSLATSSGNQAVSLLVNGTQQVVKIGVNAFIPIPGRKSVKDGNGNKVTVDTKTGQPV